MGLTWRFIFEPVSGLANWALRSVGLAPSLWLSSPDTALLSVLIADSWQWVPFVTLIVLAGIQSISTEVIEAARLDGLRGLAFLRRMVLPLIWPVLIVVILIRMVDSIRVFDLFYIMTRGGPGSSTLVSSVYGFTMFQTGRLSDMAALGLTLLVAINIVATLALSLLARSERNRATAS
jgi:multiple sugar transport system permease protein